MADHQCTSVEASPGEDWTCVECGRSYRWEESTQMWVMVDES